MQSLKWMPLYSVERCIHLNEEAPLKIFGLWAINHIYAFRVWSNKLPPSYKINVCFNLSTNPWIPDEPEINFCSMLLVNVVVYDVRQWQITLLAEVLIHRPPSSVTLSAELKELYVHKTNGGFTRWLPWKMAAPKAYFFRTECGGWWMLGDGSFWACSFLDRRDFQLILISASGALRPSAQDKILTLMSPLRVTSGLSVIHGQRRRAATRHLQLCCANRAGYQNVTPAEPFHLPIYFRWPFPVLWLDRRQIMKMKIDSRHLNHTRFILNSLN